MDAAKRAACAAIDAKRDEIIALGERVLKTPELGYKEHKTSAAVGEAFASLSLGGPERHAITGLKYWARGRERRAAVAVLGELDAVTAPGHPFCDAGTGAAHACGHNAQLAALFGCARGLIDSGVMPALSGDVCFFAVPAEEFVEIEYRRELIKKGEVSRIGGKQELILSGAFDDIDMAMMVHSETDAPCPRVVTGGTAMGFIGKSVSFRGRAAHAGGAPYEGINALNAASLAIMAINAQRETFRDADSVRIHPIITKGGDMVNIVPEDVRMESYVRAANISAMRDAAAKFDRAVAGAAYAVGADAEVTDLPGFLPLSQNERMSALFAENASELLGREAVFTSLPFAGSTDMGDLGAVMPVIQPTAAGFTGAAHSRSFAISDPELAYIVPAKLMAMTVIDLLANGAQAALEIKNSSPRLKPADYAALWEDILKKEL